jgi:hypothetical protein
MEETLYDRTAGRDQVADEPGNDSDPSRPDFAGRFLAEKHFGELVAGDRFWRDGQLFEVVKPVQTRGNVLCVKTEMLTGPLKGVPCYITGLVYGAVRIETDGADRRQGERRAT